MYIKGKSNILSADSVKYVNSHGKYPFPEATATTQVLVSGEKGGNQAKPLIYAGIIGGLYDFIVATFGWWSETVSTRVVGLGEMLAEKVKLVFKVNTGAAVLGLGYIIGLKYSAIICAGSFLVWFIIVPLMSAIFGNDVLTFGNAAITATVGSMCDSKGVLSIHRTNLNEQKKEFATERDIKTLEEAMELIFPS